MDYRLNYPATIRNRQIILGVLERILPKSGTVLEIASGSGQHINYFANQIDQLQWQPSDIDSSVFRSILAWTKHQKLEDRVLPPICIDAQTDSWPISKVYDLSAILAINLVHISPWRATTSIFRNADNYLTSEKILFFYGPYKINGHHTAESNETFDKSLKSQNIEWGVRDLDDMIELGQVHNFRVVETIKMPANNLAIVFNKNHDSNIL